MEIINTVQALTKLSILHGPQSYKTSIPEVNFYFNAQSFHISFVFVYPLHLYTYSHNYINILHTYWQHILPFTYLIVQKKWNVTHCI